jgi:D-3-phosphoglycerate dehydrogenase
LKKVLLAERIDEAGMKILEGRVEVIISPDPSGQSVGELLKEVHGLIVRTATKVTRSMIESAPHLEVISRTGGGLDNVDIEAATECDVVVCGVKGLRIVLLQSMP